MDHAQSITYRTFKKHVDMTYVDAFNEEAGIPIHKDWHVSFSKSKTLSGKVVYFFTHSSIEYIFY